MCACDIMNGHLHNVSVHRKETSSATVCVCVCACVCVCMRVYVCVLRVACHKNDFCVHSILVIFTWHYRTVYYTYIYSEAISLLGVHISHFTGLTAYT